MKRFLLFVMMCVCVSIGAWAQTTKTIIVSSTNTLASQLSSITACDYLIIKGELTDDDIAALNSISANVKHILMNEATLSEDVENAEFNFNNSYVETIVLPKDIKEVKGEWFENCQSMGCAISYSSSPLGKTLRVHSNKAGTLNDTFASMLQNNTTSDLGSNFVVNGDTKYFDENATINYDNVVLSGVYGKKDTAGEYDPSEFGTDYRSAIKTSKVRNLDLSKATVDLGTSFRYKSQLESIVLPENATTLSDNCFQGCSGLTSVILPDNLTSIPNNAFNGCTNLESIDIPASVQSIGANAFLDCSSLNTVVFGQGIHSIGENAFTRCTSMETVEFSKGITSLNFASGVFFHNESLKHVVLPEGLLNIGESMFEQCHNLESVRLPNSLQHIGANAFNECSSLTYLTIPEDVKTIGSGAFENAGIKDIYLMAQTIDKLPFIASDAFGQTPFTGNSKLAIDIAPFADRLKTLISRPEVEIKDKDGNIITDPAVVDSWLNDKNESGNYDHDKLYDKKILELLPTEEVEDVYRHLFDGVPPIAYLHYPRVDNDGAATELSYFIDGNPWKGKSFGDLVDTSKGFYTNGQEYDNGTPTWLRWTDLEIPRMLAADHLSEAYGIGPDADGYYWPDTNHSDQTLRSHYGDPNDPINSEDQNKNIATITESYNPLGNSAYEGFSKYYWRNFLLQSGYNPKNDIVYTKLYDDTWYTMCFPFDLTDEQLEAAYQSNKFNICEFSGAAILPSKKKNNSGEDVNVQNLVLCFTKIARTWYKDKYDNYYKRTVANDQNKTKHYYAAKRKWEDRGNGASDWNLVDISSTELPSTGDTKDVWESIEGFLALAGHPYMIHPYLVENNDGTASLCTIPRIEYKYKFNKRSDDMNATELAELMNNMADLYNREAVTRPICTITDSEGIFGKDQDGVTQGDGKSESYGRYDDMTPTEFGSYTFKGTYFPKKDEEIVTGEQTEKVIPYGAYFLGVKASVDPKYPKFFREISTDQNRTKGLWRQYTAIIEPDAKAKAWENEHLTGATHTIQTGAKGISMLFGDFDDVVSEEVIQGIATEAKRMGLEVQRTDIIVNINGQILRPGAGVEGLPKGIYIINGKKYLVK